MHAVLSGNEYNAAPMSTDMLEDIRDGMHYARPTLAIK